MNSRQSVSRHAFRIKLAGPFHVSEKRAAAIRANTLPDAGQRSIEPDRDTRGVNDGAVVRINIGTAPQRDNGLRSLAKLLQVLALEPAEVRLAEPRKDLADREF